MASHDFDDEVAVLEGGGAGDGVDGLDDALQSGVGSDGHVGADEVVVDGSADAGDGERGMRGRVVGSEDAVGDELLEVVGPLGGEKVGAGE